MKSRVLLLMIPALILGTVVVFAAEKTKEFKVYGNCGMCENRIESAASDVDGVISADWNKQTKMMVVTYDDSKTDIHSVHKSVAEAGHDTEMHRASGEAYNNLPGCCKYNRGS